MSDQQPDETEQSTDQSTSTDTGQDSTQNTGQDSKQDTGQDTGQDSGGPGEISDADLPEDLRPSEDNPLARHPGQTGDEGDAIGQDTEGEPQTAPMHEGQAEYGSRDSQEDSSKDSSGHTGGDGPQDGRVGAEESDGAEDLENGGGGAG